MLEKHTTKDGDSMLIAQMADEHLTNFIKMICRQIVNRQSLAKQVDIVDDYQRQLYKVEKIDTEKAARQNRQAFELLYPYLAEAYVRGLNEPKADVIKALGRKTSIQDASVVLLPDTLEDSLNETFENMLRKEIKNSLAGDDFPF